MSLYTDSEPGNAELDAIKGALLIEFGAPWCPHCQAAQALIAPALADHPGLRHLQIEDGRGKPLGRRFKVKLWPTLIFLQDGNEVARLVRPSHGDDIRRALAQLGGTSPAA